MLLIILWYLVHMACHTTQHMGLVTPRLSLRVAGSCTWYVLPLRNGSLLVASLLCLACLACHVCLGCLRCFACLPRLSSLARPAGPAGLADLAGIAWLLASLPCLLAYRICLALPIFFAVIVCWSAAFLSVCLAACLLASRLV